MTQGPLLLRDVGIATLGAAAVGVPAYLGRVPLLLAYISAGVVLGPHLGLGVIAGAESISLLSEIGLVLLMFILGLEIDLRKLAQAGKAVLINGVTQFLGCVALGLGFFSLLGSAARWGKYGLVYLAVVTSLSSTLVVVKILSDRMELGSLTSRISLGVLVLQDIWAIAFLAVQPNLSELGPWILILSMGKAAVLVGTSWALARYLLPVVFSKTGKQPELLLLVAMGWCFGICGLAERLGLSLEMGALVAGISIASFPYHVDIAAKVSSLRDFFITLFFVALGLQIPRLTEEVILLASGIVGFVLVSRLLTVFPVLYALRYGNRAGLIASVNLSQVSEFALVLATLGAGYGHIRPEMLSALILALVATVLISSVLIPNSHLLYRWINPALELVGFKDRVVVAEAGTAHENHPKLVLLGFFREASSLLQEIRERHSPNVMKDLMVVDFNPEAHHKLVQLGIRCKYGDISHMETLRHLGLEHAKLLVCTMPDQVLKGTSNLKLLRGLKALAPNAKIIVTAENTQQAKQMYQEGATYVYIPRIVGAHYLADVLERVESDRSDQIRANARAFLDRWDDFLV